MYEKALGGNYGDVSNDSEALLEFTANANNALDDYLLIWAKCAGTWQGDDTNHTTKYPIISLPIISGQRDYQFTNDEQGNLINDISKVLILPSATATEYVEISPIDELRTELSQILVNTNTGTPYQYGKFANSIFLDPIPNYSVNAGIKMIINREGSYFDSGDTTKKAGVPAYHNYFYLKPALEKARINSLPNLAQLEKDVVDLEGSERLRVTGKIQEFFSRRERDVKKRLVANLESNK